MSLFAAILNPEPLLSVFNRSECPVFDCFDDDFRECFAHSADAEVKILGGYEGRLAALAHIGHLFGAMRVFFNIVEGKLGDVGIGDIPQMQRSHPSGIIPIGPLAEVIRFHLADGLDDRQISGQIVSRFDGADGGLLSQVKSKFMIYPMALNRQVERIRRSDLKRV